MDFFEAQARAKQRTTRLVLLFVLAVLGTIAAGYAAAMVLWNQSQRFEGRSGEYYYNAGRAVRAQWWNPQVFAWVAGITTAIVGLGSLFKAMQMRRGGAAVAEMLGGRLLEPQTRDLREKRLLNIVEEMAIAAGVPMPAVYILDDEPGLNAFAAGLTTHDAAVAVTRGMLEKMTRDELQGVIAHEFSHILNGDMRLNVRIMAVVFGILVIGLIGRGILRGVGRGRVRSSGGGKNKGGGVALLLAVGVALLIIGYVGYFFGRLIQAAVSRQREFLADAAAVQFTRNPGGISGALKKIGGYALGGNLVNNHAAEVGHFLFTQAFKSNFGGLWATHPPLAERIRAIEPGWNGQLFAPPEAVDISRESFQTAGFGGPRYSPEETAARAFSAEAQVPPTVPRPPVPFRPADVVADVGALTESHLRQAQAVVAAIPERLRDAAHEPSLAPALVFGLLLQGGDRAARDQQLALLARETDEATLRTVADLRAPLSVLDPAARLPLLQLCEPALRRLDRAALGGFLHALDELVHADAQVSPFEYAMQKMLAHHLRLAHGDAARRSRPRPDDPVLVVACLARLGQRPEAQAEAAFRAGSARLAGAGAAAPMPAATECTLERLDAALDRLAAAPLATRQQLLVAAAHAIGHDGTVTVEEADLFRALAATLDCPVPPLSGA